ncbi:MAG: rRNA maturation RNase YbeY [Patescibacteria group bacterium]
MLSLELNKRVKCSWTKNGVEKVFSIIQKKVKLNGGLEVNIVGDKEMKGLNFRYRGKNKTTDVLSFAWQEDKIIKTKNLGQIYICYPQIARQAAELSVNVKEEFARMLTHGLLHIVGYDHIEKQDAKKMFKIQEEIVCLYAGC